MEENSETEKKERNVGLELKQHLDKMLETIIDENSIENNIDYISRVIDINKDIENIEYWKTKEENMMRYNRGYMPEYGEYGDGSYGRRGMPGTGRGRYNEGSYGRRGVKGTGRGRYRGEEMLDRMMEEYGNYSEGKDMYGADQDTMESFKYMLKAFKDYYKHLKQEASSSEEVQLLEDTAREIADM